MRLFFFSLFLLPLTLFAQKKLPLECPELKSKLQQIKGSYKSFDSWKKQQTGEAYEDKWTTEFTLCGVPGLIEVAGDDDISLLFDFKGYVANELECEAFIIKLSNVISEVFDYSVFEEEKDEGDEWMPETNYYHWRDYRITSTRYEEVEIKYPGIDTPLELRFRRWK
jgi:hypothetical protein